LLEWEREHFNSAVTDIFGYHALQLGLPDLDTLHDNRMPHKWMATPRVPMAMRDGVLQPALVTDFSALPFPEASLDLVVLPHTLELSHDPHATLREVERVLVPEGRVVISCLNPPVCGACANAALTSTSTWDLASCICPLAGTFWAIGACVTGCAC
jgi:SAM-dependent methyltransferase